jgi:serine/threonine protein kinase
MRITIRATPSLFQSNGRLQKSSNSVNTVYNQVTPRASPLNLTDVWSFGVVMWETFSSGKTPYAAMNNIEVLDKINEGYRLPLPHECPKKMYELMQRCWKKVPGERPSFKEMYAEFEEGPRDVIEFNVTNEDPEAQLYHTN